MTEEESKIPSESVSLESIKWKGTPVTELVEDGWRPHRKMKHDGTLYLTMRKGNHERSLGLYDPEKHLAIKMILPPSKMQVDRTDEEIIRPDMMKIGSPDPDSSSSPETEQENEEETEIGEPESIPLQVRKPQSTFLRTPITRHATIPKTFVPTIKVLRYFEILKETGYTGDFNEFVNEIVETHWEKCHGLLTPLIIRQKS